MGNLLETIVRESYEFVESKHKSTHESKALAHTMATTEITCLQEHNTLVTCLLKGLERRGAEGKRTRDGAFKVIHPMCLLFNVELIFLCSRPWQHLDRLSTKDFRPCKAL
jgi:hypothetical protein